MTKAELRRRLMQARKDFLTGTHNRTYYCHEKREMVPKFEDYDHRRRERWVVEKDLKRDSFDHRNIDYDPDHEYELLSFSELIERADELQGTEYLIVHREALTGNEKGEWIDGHSIDLANYEEV